jgi:hypothetical protein
MNAHLASALAPGTRLVAAIAPGLTIGFVLPSGLASIAASELNGRPVAFTPTRSWTSSGPRSSHTSAKRNGFETLMIANSYRASPTAKTAPLIPTTHRPKRSGDTRARAG